MAKQTAASELREALQSYLYAVAGKSETHQRWVTQKATVFVEWLEEQEVTLSDFRPIHLQQFHQNIRERTYRGRPLSSYTVKGYDEVVKAFLGYCVKADYFDEARLLKVIKNVETPKVDIKVIETFTAEQIKRLFTACAQEETPGLVARDRAALALLLDTGVRANELCTLTLDRTFLNVSDPYIRVIGKGSKEREVGLGNRAREHVHRYLARYRKAPFEEKHLILNRLREPLQTNGLDQMLYRLRDWAGIDGVRCSAHTFRHTFAVNYLLAGGDVYVLSRILGHTAVSTTEIYLRAVKQRDVRSKRFSPLDAL